MAIKHNNIVPNVHFRKWWQKYVKTWFNQAGRKKTRRTARQKKAEACAPRPLGLLRPAVHPPTVRYNFKIRTGRGFTLQELKKAGIAKTRAQSLGIAVDHRRHNHCEETLKTNADRLKKYMSKQMLLPVKNKPRKGDAKRADVKAAKATSCKEIIPLPKEGKRTKAAVITEDMKKTSAYRALNLARRNKRCYGKKLKREKEAAEKEKAPK